MLHCYPRSFRAPLRALSGARLLWLLLLLLLLAGAPAAFGQSVGIGNTSPHTSAVLDVSSTTKGFLPPRMTHSQRDAIGAPAAGLTIYNTTTGKLNTWNGTSWTESLTTTEQPSTNPAATFNYTGSAQTYVVPNDVRSISVDAAGAQGGNAYFGNGSNSGRGGRVQAVVPVTPGETLIIEVGGQGSGGNPSSAGGGYNGGATGWRNSGGGGGATDIRRGGNALANRVLVVGGGGGQCNADPFGYPSGGGGGGLVGGTGDGASPGLGGTGGSQSSGGTANAVLGIGGDGTPSGGSRRGGGGGGGGYYGGGGGYSSGGSGGTICDGGAGGGGSSWTVAGAGSVVHTQGYRTGNGSLTITPAPGYAAPVLSGINFVGVPGDQMGKHSATRNLSLNTTFDLLLRDTTNLNHGLGWYGTGKLWNGLTLDGPALYGFSSGVLGTNQNGTRTSGLYWNSTGQVGVGTTGPAPSAQLEVASTTRGFLPPRLTQGQRDAISSPAAGLTIYNTTNNKLNTWNGTYWTESLTTSDQPTPQPATTFNFTGGTQTYTVPAGVTSISLTALGAKGGSPTAAGTGANGAQVQAILPVTPGEVLTLYVGGAGTLAPVGPSGGGGGYNGGGNGGYSTVSGGGGGGASDIRRGGTALANRLLVAAGGGGGSYAITAGGAGGAGGAPNGTAGTAESGGTPGAGATQTAGGNQGGALGQGGNSVTNKSYGGGGGGYYGGGAGIANGGGGGGSSWVAPSGWNVTMTPGVGGGNGSITLAPSPYAAPVLDGANFVNVPGTWDVSGADVYRAGGNVGIGTTAPSQKLEVTGTAAPTTSTTAPLLRLSRPTTTGVKWPNTFDMALGSYATGINSLSRLDFNLGNGANGNADVTVLTLNGNGNVGIGTTAPTEKLEVAGNVAIPAGNDLLVKDANHGIGWYGATNPFGSSTTDGPVVYGYDGAVLGISRGATRYPVLTWTYQSRVGIGTTNPLTTLSVSQVTSQTNTPGQVIGEISFVGFNRTVASAGIRAESPAFDDVSHLLFKTSENASGAVERMRIASTGEVSIATDNTQQLIITSTSGDPTGVISLTVPATNTACNTCSELIIFNKAGGGTIGSIGSNLSGNSVTYNTTSDKRLKEHITRTRFGLTDLLKIQVKDYNFIGNAAANRVTGFLAQDLFRIYPDAVKEGDYGPTVTNTWAVDYGRLTPLLVQAIQDQQVEIEALKTRLLQADADHASLLTLQQQMARLLGEAPPATQARR